MADFPDRSDDIGEAQRRHWQSTYADHPGMYGEHPSAAAIVAAHRFAGASAREVLELGAGHGRDALYLARSGYSVTALDFSSTALDQLQRAADHQGVGERVRTGLHDVREPLPLPDSSADGVFAHMLLCMALSTGQIHDLVGQVRRVLRPGGLFSYTVRHTGDAHYGVGSSLGDDIYQTAGFAVHFFSRELVQDLARDWELLEVAEFQEGDLPRRLWQIHQRRSD